MPEFDLATVDGLLTTTRAVRRRLDLTRPVPMSVVDECLRLAIHAPTAGDAQNWRWLVVTDVGLRKAIAEVHRGANEEFARRQLDVLVDGPERRRFQSVVHLIDHLHDVPVHVLAFVLEPKLEGLGGAPPPPVLLYGSIFPAVWSFQLALRSRGLGTTPLYVADDEAITDLVGAPPEARIASLLPVAYYTGNTFRPARRLPLDTVRYRDRWGQEHEA